MASKKKTKKPIAGEDPDLRDLTGQEKTWALRAARALGRTKLTSAYWRYEHGQRSDGMSDAEMRELHALARRGQEMAVGPQGGSRSPEHQRGQSSGSISPGSSAWAGAGAKRTKATTSPPKPTRGEKKKRGSDRSNPVPVQRAPVRRGRYDESALESILDGLGETHPDDLE